LKDELLIAVSFCSWQSAETIRAVFIFDFSESYEYNKRMPENRKKSEPT